LGFKGKGGALSGILGIRRNQAYSGVIFDGSCDFYAEFIANRGAVRRLPGELGSEEYEIYQKSKDEVLSGMSKPTIADIQRDIDRKEGWVKNFDIEEEIKKLTDRYSVESSLASDIPEAVME